MPSWLSIDRLTSRFQVARIAWTAALAWKSDNVPRLSAALSYYTLFSLAPLLILVIAVLGLMYDQGAVRSGIITEVANLVGDSAAQAVDAMLQDAGRPKAGLLSGGLSVIMLVVGAGGVFIELKASLNLIWKVETKPGLGIWALVSSYFAPFAMVLGIGFLLLVSLVLSAGMAALGKYLEAAMPGTAVVLVHGGDFLLSCAITATLFALIYRILPDVRLGWSQAWVGAWVAAVLFSLGRFLIGLYLGRTGVASTYGAAGSLVVILVWVYYSAQILFFGAEVCRAFAQVRSIPVAPVPNAQPMRVVPAR